MIDYRLYCKRVKPLYYMHAPTNTFATSRGANFAAHAVAKPRLRFLEAECWQDTLRLS